MPLPGGDERTPGQHRQGPDRMNLNAIKDFLTRDKPRFICTAEGSEGEATYTAWIEHHATDPGAADVALLSEAPESLRSFFSEFGSLRLYCDAHSSSSAFYLARPSEWAQLQQEFLNWIRMLSADGQSMVPDWVEDCVVFGEIPETGNYLIMPRQGPEAGKVYLFDCQAFDFVEEAPDLSAYLLAITTPDEALYEKIRQHTRYSDGETATQWLVREYASAS